MAQGNKLDIEDTALILTHAANAHSVALSKLTVKTGLRPVVLVEDLDRRVGS